MANATFFNFYKFGLVKTIKIFGRGLPKPNGRGKFLSSASVFFISVFFILWLNVNLDPKCEALLFYSMLIVDFYFDSNIWKFIGFGYLNLLNVDSIHSLYILSTSFVLAFLYHIKRLNECIKHNPNFTEGMVYTRVDYEYTHNYWYLFEILLFSMVVFFIPYGLILQAIEISSSTSILKFLGSSMYFVFQIFFALFWILLFFFVMGIELLYAKNYYWLLKILPKYRITEPVGRIIGDYREQVEEDIQAKVPITKTIYKFWHIMLTNKVINFSFFNISDFFIRLIGLRRN